MDTVFVHVFYDFLENKLIQFHNFYFSLRGNLSCFRGA